MANTNWNTCEDCGATGVHVARSTGFARHADGVRCRECHYALVEEEASVAARAYDDAGREENRTMANHPMTPITDETEIAQSFYRYGKVYGGTRRTRARVVADRCTVEVVGGKDRYDRKVYFLCREAPAFVDSAGVPLCEDHAAKAARGYGLAHYGFCPEERAARAAGRGRI